jgi:hypothetical protein
LNAARKFVIVLSVTLQNCGKGLEEYLKDELYDDALKNNESISVPSLSVGAAEEKKDRAG